MKAFFGPPLPGPAPGGTQLTIYLVPVFEGQLICFDVTAKAARGRWLPWDVLDLQENPYEAASELADIWCGVPATSLELADVMSFNAPGSPWELAVIFRCTLSEPALGDADRHPYMFPRGRYDAIGQFDPVDLERWVKGAEADAAQVPAPAIEPSRRGDLLF